MALIPAGFLDSVLAIGVVGQDGSHNWFATGFLYGQYQHRWRDREVTEVYLVTNRHVLEGVEVGLLRCNPTRGRAKVFEVAFVGRGQRPTWRAHPDPDVDVAVMSLNYQALLDAGLRVSYFDSRHHAAQLAGMRRMGIAEGDPVHVLGFPQGDVGAFHNSVIVRSGAIARIGETYSKRSTTFLLDAFVFPGNSGGPIVYRPSGMALEGTKTANEPYLIGVVMGYVPWDDHAISQQSGQVKISFQHNTGLALAFPVDRIEEAIQAGKTPAKRTARRRKAVRTS